MMCSKALDSRGKPAVSPMSGSPTFDVDKKKQKRGEFKTPPRPTGRRSNKLCIARKIVSAAQAKNNRKGLNLKAC